MKNEQIGFEDILNASNTKQSLGGKCKDMTKDSKDGKDCKDDICPMPSWLQHHML
jgi:hypothetical protein